MIDFALYYFLIGLIVNAIFAVVVMSQGMKININKLTASVFIWPLSLIVIICDTLRVIFNGR